MPQIAPGSGGTFTYWPEDPRWRWSHGVLDLFEVPPDEPDRVRALLDEDASGHPVRLVDGVQTCLATGVGFVTVVQSRSTSGHLRWTVCGGELVASGEGRRVEGWVMDVSAPLNHAAGEQASAHLSAALAGRQVIDLVKGAVMAAYGLGADAAFDLLVWCSQRANVRVHDLSQRVVARLSDGAGIAGTATRDLLERALVEGEDGAVSGPVEARAPLHLRQSGSAGTTVLSVAGTVDLGNAPQLAGTLVRQVDRLASGHVLVVDLRDVDHLGPAGLSVLQTVARRGTATGVKLRLVAPERHHHRLDGLADLVVDSPLEDRTSAGAVVEQG